MNFSECSAWGVDREGGGKGGEGVNSPCLALRPTPYGTSWMLTISRKRTHLLGQPPSTTTLHSTFTCGFVLLYAVFLNPTILPLREAFSAIKSTSNTLFTYSNGDWTSVPLYDVFEKLSAICIERMTSPPSSAPQEENVQSELADSWQKASLGAAVNMAGEIDCFRLSCSPAKPARCQRHKRVC